MKTKYRMSKTENGWEVWDGIAYEAPPLAFETRIEALKVAGEMNSPRKWHDESAGSILTGRDWD